MLTLLRKIRKSLIESGGARKYFLYAIGEITLVVIGILIALQINNWNNDQKDRREEDGILRNLMIEYQNSIDELKHLNDQRSQVIKVTNEIFSIASKEKNMPPVSKIDSLLGVTFNDPTFNGRQGTLDVLFASGKINLLTNEDLKNQIITWPGFVEDMVEEELYASDMFHATYFPLIKDFIVVEEIGNTIPSVSRFGADTDLSNYYTLPQNLIAPDYVGLFHNKAFLNILSMRAAHMKVTYGETLSLILKAEDIIELIEQQLNSGNQVEK